VSGAEGWYPPIAGDSQLIPYFNDAPMIVMEAENFTVTPAAAGAPPNEWVAGDWGHSATRFAATIANTFASRRSLLHAPASVNSSSIATMPFTVRVLRSDRFARRVSGWLSFNCV
jgi:hypothetical protein